MNHNELRNYTEAVIACERFVGLAKKHCRAIEKDEVTEWDASPLRAAAKRASMDATRALAVARGTGNVRVVR